MNQFEAILARHGVKNVDVASLEAAMADHFGQQVLRAKLAADRVTRLDAALIGLAAQTMELGVKFPMEIEELAKGLHTAQRSNTIANGVEFADAVLDACK